MILIQPPVSSTRAINIYLDIYDADSHLESNVVIKCDYQQPVLQI